MIHCGDLFDVLPMLPAQSVHCVVSSPPYWGLRDYGNPPRTFPDGWTGCLGLEPTPELFVEHMVAAFAEVHRVLRDDGTLWLNMGDCYNAYNGGAGPSSGIEGPNSPRTTERPKLASGYGLRDKSLKPKDLVGVPWMLAFALRSWGWYLRAEIVWAKGVSFCDAYAGSVMPESVQDRPTRSHEQIFLLTKAARYFYDAEAVREQGVWPAGTMAAKGSGTREGNRRGSSPKTAASEPQDRQRRIVDRIKAAREAGAPHEAGIGRVGPDGYAIYDGTRNLRTVWAISPKPFTEAHFATFPPDLVVPCIKAGTSEKGVCAVCGAQWRRVVEKEPLPEDVKADFEAARQRTAEEHGRDDGFTTRRPNFQRGRGATTWEPMCDHADAEIVPATVMDCFSGAGTVGAVAAELHRRYAGVEINSGYVEIAKRRIASVAPLFTEAV